MFAQWYRSDGVTGGVLYARTRLLISLILNILWNAARNKVKLATPRRAGCPYLVSFLASRDAGSE